MSDIWDKTIVKVKYGTEGEGREYTYFAEEPLAVGDLVNVPVKDRTTTARVTAINVPESSIAAYRDAVKTIPAGSKIVAPEPAAEFIPGQPAPEIGPGPHQKCIPTAEGVRELLGQNPPEELFPEPTETLPLPEPLPEPMTEETLKAMSEGMEGAFDGFEDGVQPAPPMPDSPDGTPPVTEAEAEGMYSVIKKTVTPEVAARMAEANVIQSDGYEITAYMAQVKILPEEDKRVQGLYNEAVRLKEIAEARTVANDADVKALTDDLAIIAGVREKLDTVKKEYEAPIKKHLEDFRDVFNRFVQPLIDADRINREKWSGHRADVKAAQARAEETNRMAEEVARRQAEASGTGEFTVDTTPVPAPPAPAKTVRSDLGTATARVLWRCKVIDFEKLPDKYKITDMAKLNRDVKAAKGQIQIDGVEVYSEEDLQVRRR